MAVGAIATGVTSGRMLNRSPEHYPCEAQIADTKRRAALSMPHVTSAARIRNQNWKSPCRGIFHVFLVHWTKNFGEAKPVKNGGGDRIRTCVRYAGRFTVCCL